MDKRNREIHIALAALEKKGYIRGWERTSSPGTYPRYTLTDATGVDRVFRTGEVEAFIAGIYVSQAALDS
jgi:hypothetical protein